MNRPRNRHPRGGRPPRSDGPRGGPRGPPRDYNSNVPTIQQVTPGAAVSIVLKEDQGTGREVQGVVQNLLTRGNHPRGIKVRLQDGQVGRVQRMAVSSTAAPAPTAALQSASVANNASSKPPARIIRMERDVRLDEADYPSLPPSRSLADFMPDFGGAGEDATSGTGHADVTSAVTATCPICGVFEGDEVAVSRHVDEHLS
ncbi:hypothetical protein LTR85_002699 [Meristemomyces frigidus]|nr:hypothetical protein LTR85_002699 [Meristemomyces frigidus]